MLPSIHLKSFNQKVMQPTSTKILYPLAAAALLPACGTAKKTEPSKPLNIVYIMTDDHTRQMMSCYDNRHIQTPNLDRIAENGVIFRNAYVANSISAPSRACLLTGKHSHKNGKIDNLSAFDGNQQTVQQLLKQAGYQTAMIGKWHLDSEPTNFDHWEILPGQGSYYNPDFITPEGRVNRKGYVTDIITDLSIEWLENRDKEKPFVLFHHHKVAHRNWMSDIKHLPLYEDKTFELPANFYDDYAGREAAAKQEMSIASAHDMDLVNDLKILHPDIQTRLGKGYELGEYARLDSAQKVAWDAHYRPIIDEFMAADLTGKELAEWKFQRYMRDYAKTIQSLDENVGRLLDYLEQNGLLGNTLIIYTSDQGFYMGEHGWFDKRFMYEESFSTPLVMMFPKSLSAKHGNIDALVQNIDFAPTMLDVAGVEIPEDIQGVSLVPLLKSQNTPADWRTSLYYHFYEYPGEHAVRRHYGVRTERYKLIRFYNDIEAWELFDLETDSMEMNNLYGKPGYEKITEEMHAELKRLQEKYDDPIREQFPQ